MHWHDRVYGVLTVDDLEIANLVATPTFQRLRGIRQAGPSAFAHPFKTVTRFEHSLGVYALLRRLSARRVEQVAGLLHDISHTAFSHAVDFLEESDEQAHHESLKPRFLNRPDVAAALDRMGYAPADFYDDSIYPLLERPLPWLCADRIDYYLRDGRACGVVTDEVVAETLNALVVVDDLICLNDLGVARRMAALYSEMNSDWWSGPTEAYIYNEFAEVLREAMRLGALHADDLLCDDEHVLTCLKSARSRRITETLARISTVTAEQLAGYRPRVEPKTRWLDPPVVLDGQVWRLSELDGEAPSSRRPKKAS